MRRNKATDGLPSPAAHATHFAATSPVHAEYGYAMTERWG